MQTNQINSLPTPYAILGSTPQTGESFLRDPWYIIARFRCRTCRMYAICSFPGPLTASSCPSKTLPPMRRCIEYPMRTEHKQPRMMRKTIALREISHSLEAMLRIDRCDAGGICEGCQVGCKGLGSRHTHLSLLIKSVIRTQRNQSLDMCVCVMV